MRTMSATVTVVLAHLRLSFVELLAGESIPGAPSRHEPGLGVAYLKREIARESAYMGYKKTHRSERRVGDAKQALSPIS